VGRLLVLNISPKALVLGGLFKVVILKGVAQVGPVGSAQQTLGFSTEFLVLQLHFSIYQHLEMLYNIVRYGCCGLFKCVNLNVNLNQIQGT
jgi:hypothetical protein